MTGKRDGFNQSTSLIMAHLNGLPESSMAMWTRTKVGNMLSCYIYKFLSSAVIVDGAVEC